MGGCGGNRMLLPSFSFLVRILMIIFVLFPNITSTYDEYDHEKPPSSKEMKALYGRGYELLKLLVC